MTVITKGITEVGNPLDHAVEFPQALSAKCTEDASGRLFVMMTFTVNGRATHYAVDETVSAALREYFDKAIPFILQHNAPKEKQ